jgi:hypothetical protein
VSATRAQLYTGGGTDSYGGRRKWWEDFPPLLTQKQTHYWRCSLFLLDLLAGPSQCVPLFYDGGGVTPRDSRLMLQYIGLVFLKKKPAIRWRPLKAHGIIRRKAYACTIATIVQSVAKRTNTAKV